MGEHGVTRRARVLWCGSQSIADPHFAPPLRQIGGRGAWPLDKGISCLYGRLMPRINCSRLIPAEVASVQHVTTRCTRQLHMLAHAEGEPEGLRKEILLSRIEELVEQMAVEILAIALMDNHVHLVLRTRPRIAAARPAEEVCAAVAHAPPTPQRLQPPEGGGRGGFDRAGRGWPPPWRRRGRSWRASRSS